MPYQFTCNYRGSHNFGRLDSLPIVCKGGFSGKAIVLIKGLEELT